MPSLRCRRCTNPARLATVTMELEWNGSRYRIALCKTHAETFHRLLSSWLPHTVDHHLEAMVSTRDARGRLRLVDPDEAKDD